MEIRQDGKSNLRIFNGNCETTAANSSNISSTSGSDDKKVDEKKSDDRRSIADSLKERLSTRGD